MNDPAWFGNVILLRWEAPTGEQHQRSVRQIRAAIIDRFEEKRG